MPATGIRTSSSATCGSARCRTRRGRGGHGGRGSGRDGRGGRRRSRRRPAGRCPAGPGRALLRPLLAAALAAGPAVAALPRPCGRRPVAARGHARGHGRAHRGRGGRPRPPSAVAAPRRRPALRGGAASAFGVALRLGGDRLGAPRLGRGSARGARRLPRAAALGLGAAGARRPAGRESRSAAGPRPSRPRRSAGGSAFSRGGVHRPYGPWRWRGAWAWSRRRRPRRLGRRQRRRACASLMTSISWLLRIRAVPLMPRPDATCCSSASTMPSRPVPDGAAGSRHRWQAPRRPWRARQRSASTRAPIRSVVSLTKGPSLERTSACLARRPVVLSGFGPWCVTVPGRWSAGSAEEYG